MNKTLIDYLEKAAEYASYGESKYIRIVSHKDSIKEITYKGLKVKAKKIASKLIKMGLRKGDQIIFQLRDIETFMYMFWGCLYAGIQPVPLSIPMMQNENTEACVKIRNVFDILKQPMLVVEHTDMEFYLNLFAEVNEKVVDVNNLLSDIESYSEYVEGEINENDVAFIQFSSGSTGHSKGVMLTHYNLLTNAKQISKGIDADSSSIACSWMPLTHDMGLIGFHLTSAVIMCSQTIFAPEVFIRYPLYYIKYLAEEKVSYTGFPNFGIEWILKFVKKNQLEGMDFSALKCILNGAEPIDCNSSEKLLELFKENGLDETCMCFSYGMAEACVAVALSGRRKIQSVTIDGYDYAKNNKITYTEKNDMSITLALIAPPLEGIEIAIIDEDGNVLSENEIGEICIKGDNVTQGYFNYDNSQIFTSEGYFKTGDIGFITNGNVVISGRKKDIIFKNGANYYAHDIERVVSDIEPTLKGNIVVIQARKGRKKDAIVLLLKGSYSDEECQQLKTKINNEMLKRMGIILDDFSCIKTILKTTSGKVKRYLLQQEYEENIKTSA